MARQIQNIVVHHSDSNWGDGAVIEHWHTDPKPRGNGWTAPGYHVVVCNGYPNYFSWSNHEPVISAHGRIDRILSEAKVANGCKYSNVESLHVCMIGNFDKDFPSEIQKAKFLDLLGFWCQKYSLQASAIYGHGEMQRKIGKEGYSKTCPGNNVNMDKIRVAISDRLK